MKQKQINILIGSVAAIICAGILIYAIEEQKSLWQIFLGFLIFVIPFTFLSSFGSKVGAFIFVFATALITYLVNKFFFYDFWLGVILAAIIGGSAFYFRVRTYKPFDPSRFKEKAKTQLKKEKNNER